MTWVYRWSTKRPTFDECPSGKRPFILTGSYMEPVYAEHVTQNIYCQLPLTTRRWFIVSLTSVRKPAVGDSREHSLITHSIISLLIISQSIISRIRMNYVFC